MGFFKDAKKGIQGANELGQYHGGMPSVRGAFKDIAAVTDDRGQGEVLEKGIPAKGVAKSFAEMIPGDRFGMHILMEIHPPNGTPYDVDVQFATARMKAAVTVGMELPVKIHPDDPQRVAIQWDAQQANIAAQGGDMNAVMTGMQNAYGNVADTAYQQQRAKDASEDPVSKLEKLKQMRDAGLITDAEYDAKKSEVLGQM